MAITDEAIAFYEQKYDLDIERLPNGRYEVETNRTHENFRDSFDDDNTRYQIEVTPIEETIDVSEEFARSYGVEPTGDPAVDFARINRVAFDRSPAADTFEDEHPGFTDSHLHRASIVGAWLRSNGQVPPESWAEDHSFGASGAGPAIVAGGGQGGALSRIGPAHDTDYTLGAAGNVGPMADLGELVERTGEAPSGMHGIPNTALTAARIGGIFDSDIRDGFRRFQAERELMPELRDLPAYDSPFSEHPDWDVDMISPTSWEASQETQELLAQPPGAPLQAVNEMLDRGFDQNDIVMALEQTEDQHRNDPWVADLQNVRGSTDATHDAEDDLSIV